MTASESLHQRSPPIKEKPQQRNAANARERARMRVLSRAFCRLKTTLPWVPADTKLSKLDTLRLATTYIAHLRAVLIDGSSTDSSPLPSHPLSMQSWPFMFNKSGGDHGPSSSPVSGSESPSSSDHYGYGDDPHDRHEHNGHHQHPQAMYQQHHLLPDSSHTSEMVSGLNTHAGHVPMYSSIPIGITGYADHLMESH